MAAFNVESTLKETETDVSGTYHLLVTQTKSWPLLVWAIELSMHSNITSWCTWLFKCNRFKLNQESMSDPVADKVKFRQYPQLARWSGHNIRKKVSYNYLYSRSPLLIVYAFGPCDWRGNVVFQTRTSPQGEHWSRPHSHPLLPESRVQSGKQSTVQKIGVLGAGKGYGTIIMDYA